MQTNSPTFLESIVFLLLYILAAIAGAIAAGALLFFGMFYLLLLISKLTHNDSYMHIMWFSLAFFPFALLGGASLGYRTCRALFAHLDARRQKHEKLANPSNHNTDSPKWSPTEKLHQGQNSFKNTQN